MDRMSCLSLSVSLSQDTVMTLEATTEYGRKIPRTHLNQWINVDYTRAGALARVHLNKTRPQVSMEVRIVKHAVKLMKDGEPGGQWWTE